MAGLGLNIIIDRMGKPGQPFAERLEQLGAEVADALMELEYLVREEARSAGVAEADLDEHAGTAVGVVVGNRCRGVVADAAKRRAARRFPVRADADTQ
ncbi:hypothetical protein AB0M39_40970 [Streptomyces sp. NPDC051907]|uniref:hypothetical protein n=1 Tax=Streptomyces sp. NPDC051907 TaxID=3155284 RepID=UPI003439F8A8